jgi:anti-sigma B factor antagonist
VSSFYSSQRGKFLDLYLQNDRLSGRIGVTVIGEVDISNAHVLEDYLKDEIQSGQKDLSLNVAELSFIDSTGLAVLLNIRKLLQSFDRSLVLVSPSRAVERVLEMTGLDRIFQIETAGREEYPAAKVSA